MVFLGFDNKFNHKIKIQQNLNITVLIEKEIMEEQNIHNLIDHLIRIGMLQKSEETIKEFSNWGNSIDESIFFLSTYIQQMQQHSAFEMAKRIIMNWLHGVQDKNDDKSYINVYNNKTQSIQMLQNKKPETQIQQKGDQMRNNLQMNKQNSTQNNPQAVFQKTPNKNSLKFEGNQNSNRDSLMNNASGVEGASDSQRNQRNSQFKTPKHQRQVFQKLYRESRDLSQSQLMMLREKQESQLERCSFHPTLSKRTDAIAEERNKKFNHETENDCSSENSNSLNVFERLSRSRPQNMLPELILKIREEAQVQDCTFKPQISDNSLILSTQNRSMEPAHLRLFNDSKIHNKEKLKDEKSVSAQQQNKHSSSVSNFCYLKNSPTRLENNDEPVQQRLYRLHFDKLNKMELIQQRIAPQEEVQLCTFKPDLVSKSYYQSITQSEQRKKSRKKNFLFQEDRSFEQDHFVEPFNNNISPHDRLYQQGFEIDNKKLQKIEEKKKIEESIVRIPKINKQKSEQILNKNGSQSERNSPVHIRLYEQKDSRQEKDAKLVKEILQEQGVTFKPKINQNYKSATSSQDIQLAFKQEDQQKKEKEEKRDQLNTQNRVNSSQNFYSTQVATTTLSNNINKNGQGQNFKSIGTASYMFDKGEKSSHTMKMSHSIINSVTQQSLITQKENMNSTFRELNQNISHMLQTPQNSLNTSQNSPSFSFTSELSQKSMLKENQPVSSIFQNLLEKNGLN